VPGDDHPLLATTETASYWAQLLDANSNNLARPDLLYAGQALNLPDNSANAEPASPLPRPVLDDYDVVQNPSTPPA
jgi:hypothetical protein